jgi:hypothetical protein
MKLTTQLHLELRSRIVGLYLHYIYLHGVVLNELSAGTTWPLRSLSSQPV